MSVITGLEENAESSGEKFRACFSTNKIWLVAIIKHFLESNNMIYVFTGEDLLPLSGGAIASTDSAATLYLLEKDIPEFLAFIGDKD